MMRNTIRRSALLGAGVLLLASVQAALAVQVNFKPSAISSMDLGQDQGTSTVHDSGDRIELNGNAWKRIEIPYVITANTVIEFDFRSSSQGEIHGIGLETDNIATENRFFQIAGAHTWGRQNFRNYSGTGWKRFVIPVGQYYTGGSVALAFVNDHDVPSPTAQGEFRHVQVYEAGSAGSVNFNSHTINGYGGLDQGTSTVQDSGNRLVLTGNAWKKVDRPYTITRNTVLEFDFQGVVEGDLHGIGLDADNTTSLDQVFQLWGTETSGIQDRRIYAGSGWYRHTIPVGQYYTAANASLVFINKRAPSGPAVQGQFRNVKLYEACVPSDVFVDSVGLGIKAWQGSAAQQGPRIVARVQDLGVRHVRDWLSTDKPIATPTWTSLKNAGVRFCFSLTNWADSDSGRLQNLNGFKAYLKNPANGSLVTATDFIEHTNEPNDGTGALAAGTVFFNTNLTSIFRGDPATASIPILSSPMAQKTNLATAHANLGDQTALVDFGNIHPYPGGAPPHANVANAMTLQAINTANYPIIATETGYHSYAPEPHHHPAPEDVSAIYLPRLYFDYFRRGIHRTYFYQLADDNAAGFEGHFGLVGTDVLTPKPGYHALKNLIHLMKDVGGEFTAVPLNVTISGTTDVRGALFQTRTGKYRLALWRDISIWNQSTRQPITAVNANITLTFPSTRTKVDVYKPNISTAIQSSYTGVSSVTLVVGSYTQIIEF